MTLPDFRSPAFLQDHIRDTQNFYQPRVVDSSGGFFQFFRDDGTVYDHKTRHLVSSARFIFNYAMAARHFGDPADLEAVRHGLRFLRDVHRDPATGGYTWLLAWNGDTATVLDPTRHCYGMAFVLLAHAHALMAGLEEARDGIAETYAVMEQHFFDPKYGLYGDEATPQWLLNPYRGQNANMHSCEAMLAAFEATGEPRYLDRAALLADNITRRQAALTDHLIWEHYHQDWSPDWDYNRHDKSNIFRPWGYQPGHLAEWAKLLLTLDEHRPADWHVPRAIALFDAAVRHAWDDEYGGLVYGFAPDGTICDGDKYHWVQAESLAAAARLAQRTANPDYWRWYDRIWAYSWEHLVDHRYGAWFRLLSRDNRSYSDEKSPAGKTDYHTMGACYDVLHTLGIAKPFS
ncbi:MAG: AGE family epimerase/isomerase [Azospirillaceae bacterium]|nr:AGE family epimerase/isomerase [Azospirillaceae bacterium]